MSHDKDEDDVSSQHEDEDTQDESGGSDDESTLPTKVFDDSEPRPDGLSPDHLAFGFLHAEHPSVYVSNEDDSTGVFYPVSIGDTFGDYEVKRKLAAGPHSTVWLGQSSK
jgi:hypothetical protein